jgi:hypothetical protein
LRPAWAPAAALLVLTACTPPAPPAASPSAAAPAVVSTLSAEPSAFDFGRVLPGRTLQKEFRLRNLGAHPLVIESVTTDCGCMVTGEYARELAPGGSTALTVALTTPTQPGRLVRSVVVRTATPPGTLALTVAATVVAATPAS